jgi:hypothetical protein
LISLQIIPANLANIWSACMGGLGKKFPQTCKEVPYKIITGVLNQKGTRTNKLSLSLKLHWQSTNHWQA